MKTAHKKRNPLCDNSPAKNDTTIKRKWEQNTTKKEGAPCANTTSKWNEKHTEKSHEKKTPTKNENRTQTRRQNETKNMPKKARKNTLKKVMKKRPTPTMKTVHEHVKMKRKTCQKKSWKKVASKHHKPQWNHNDTRQRRRTSSSSRKVHEVFPPPWATFLRLSATSARFHEWLLLES